MNELALFAGAGGGLLGGHLLGWRTVCAVEWEPYAASVLVARQNDGFLPPFPVWDDVQTFDGRAWRGCVDVVSGGFPCQDISVAGGGAGIDGARSGMWTHMARIVGEVRPRYVFVENSPALLTRGLGRVLGDLAALGYDCRWTVLGAADVGAPHQRDRFWLVGSDTLRHGCDPHHGGQPVRDRDGDCPSHEARRQEQQSRAGGKCGHVADADQFAGHQGRPSDADQGPRGRDVDRGPECAHRLADAERKGLQGPAWSGMPGQGGSSVKPASSGAEVRHAHGQGLAQRQGQPSHDGAQLKALERADWWESEPDVGRVADGVAARVDRLKAIGNGQVPLCAATAWRLLTDERLTHTEPA